MNQTVWTDRKIMLFSFVTAGTTVIAGISHLTMVSQSFSHNLGEGVLFLVGGILQVFWAVPVIKRWGRVWQIIGIVGTAVFVILFYLDRFHLLPEGDILGGGSHETISHGDFPRNNSAGGEFSRGNSTGREFPNSPPSGAMRGGLGRMIPQIEIFQFVFIGLYAVLSMIYSKKQKTDDKLSESNKKD